nr:Chain C, NP418 epitope from 2009 swine-influenza strain [synthetic construct]
LPFERATVM